MNLFAGQTYILYYSLEGWVPFQKARPHREERECEFSTPS